VVGVAMRFVEKKGAVPGYIGSAGGPQAGH